MKKILYSILFLALSSTVVLAQDEATTTSNATEGKSDCDGCDRTPKAGDIGFGMQAGPFLNYLGNMFNANGSNTWLNSNQVNYNNNGFGSGGVLVRYFIADDMAFRATFKATQYNTVTEWNTQLDAVTNADGSLVTQWDRVTDTRANSTTDFGLGAGIEKRKGGNRIQGYYGGELSFRRTNTRSFYEYGNQMTDDNTDPFTSNNGSVVSGSFLGGYKGYAATERYLEVMNPTVVTINLRGLLGAEYFFTKKMSLGTELGWGYYYSKSKGNKGYYSSERYVNGVYTQEQFQNNVGDSKTYGFIPSADAQIYLNLYF